MPLIVTNGSMGHNSTHPGLSSSTTSTNSLYGQVNHTASSIDRNSSLMSSATSNHHQRTRHVIASSFTASTNVGMIGIDSYSSTNSTFWPYRLLICILDQRDLAAPILEALSIDILRYVFPRKFPI